MSDRYAGSFFLSLLLHLAGAVMLVVIAYALRQSEPETTQVFELVAGPGDDYLAPEAPPGEPGSEGEVQPFEFSPPEPLPELPPMVIPEPVEPALAPVPAPVPAFAPVPVPPIPKPPPPAPPTPKPPAPRQTMTKEEFDRKFGKTTTPAQRTPAPPAPVKPKLIDPNAVRDGLRGGGGNPGSSSREGAGGTALSTQINNQMDAYFERLKSMLRRNHQAPPGVSDQLEAEFSYHIAANGRVSQVRLTRSSGNKAFDDSVLAAFATLPTLGARPDGQSSTRQLLFRMRDLP